MDCRKIFTGTFSAALAILLGAGCASIQQPDFVPVESKSGLVNWRFGERSLSADVVFQQDLTGRGRLVVTKGANLLTITQGGPDQWTATGPLARQPWRGALDEAPLPLAGWINLLAAYRAFIDLPTGTGGFMVGNYRARYDPTDGPLKRMEVIIAGTGDRFDVRF